MKITHSKTASRRSHHHASETAVIKTASGARRKHFVDPVTGMYRGKHILSTGAPAKVVRAKSSPKKAAKKAAPDKE